MIDYYATFAAQSEGALPMDAWYPRMDELQMILDDMVFARVAVYND